LRWKHVDLSTDEPLPVPSEVGQNPTRQLYLSASIAPAPSVTFDAALYVVGHIDALDVPGYTRVDSQVTWLLGHGLSLGVSGQDLLGNRAPEFRATQGAFFDAARISRRYLVRLAWQRR
jgi:hypothetical protein